MTRITFTNYGVIEHMYSDMPETKFIELFWGIYGQSGVPRNAGGIQIVSTGSVSDIQDTGGFSDGKVA